MEAQSLAVKRAEVEFHNFAALGEPERAMRVYAEENVRRGAVIRNHLGFIGAMSPFLEIGANAGHTSYMLVNEFGADGFALDLSADSLRYGVALKEHWNLERGPIRVAGDAVRLPFRDGALRRVLAFQMLYRCPYWETMKPWERRLYRWGLLGYLVRDVIGAHQEDSVGIRQNHTMGLKDWHELVNRHFTAHEYEVFVPERGWGERVVKRLAVRWDRYGSEWGAARLLGGTLAAVCRKAGEAPAVSGRFGRFESYLSCPDCGGNLRLDADEVLGCQACAYRSPNEGGVYNLLPSAEKSELYPGDRPDVIDFSLPGHAARLGDGWYELEGAFGNKYRWIAGEASARLERVKAGPQKLRIRGHAHEKSFEQGVPAVIEVWANDTRAGRWTLDRPGLFVLEAGLPDAPEYRLRVTASPTWQVPTDERLFSVNLSMIRLAPRD